MSNGADPPSGGVRPEPRFQTDFQFSDVLLHSESRNYTAHGKASKRSYLSPCFIVQPCCFMGWL